MAKAAARPLKARLRDGTRVIARPVEADDRERLRTGFERLSPGSRYRRFHASIKQLSDEQLTYFTQVDHVDHEAWVLLDADDPESPGVGIARYVRDRTDPTVAEAAITVADAYQGRGAGRFLLGLLADRARAHGIHTFRNYVLSDNTDMLSLLASLGCKIQPKADEAVMTVDLPLPASEEQLQESPLGRTLAAVARSRHRMPMQWLLPAGDTHQQARKPTE